MAGSSGKLVGVLAAAALVVLSSCSGSSSTPARRPQRGGQSRADEPRVVIDFAAVEAWLSCARTESDLAVCERASADTPGGRVATLSETTFGTGEPERPRPVAREAVQALVDRLRGWPDVAARVQRFLPAPVRGGILRVYVVANGHPWGDAYVRGVSGEGDALRLSESGEPITVLNAVLIASGYRGDAAVQADKALGVLSHEVFHALFRRYRAQTPAWAQLCGDLAPRVALQVLVLNEGVAHFVDRGPELLHDGFPSERADAALGHLAEAWERLEHAGGREAEEILRAADQGRYWDKYGSIGGMLLTYGVYRAFGLDAVRDALRCGPARLLSRYRDAAARVSGLPGLPENLDPSTWIDLCRTEPPH